MGGVGGLNKIMYVRFITVQNTRSEYNTERKCVQYRVAFPASVHAPNSLKYSCCLQPESLCTLLHSTSKALQDSERKTLRHPMHLWGEHSVLWFIARTQQKKQNTNQNENDRNQEPCSRKKIYRNQKPCRQLYTHRLQLQYATTRR